MQKKAEWYAVYKGDEFICHGTPEEVSKFLGIKEKTVNYLSTASYLKKMKKHKGDNYMVAIKVKK